MRRLKILMLTEYFPPFDRGGAEWSTFHLASTLKKKGHEVFIFTPDYGGGKKKVNLELNVYRFSYYVKLNNTSGSVSPIHHSHLLWWVWTTLCLIQQVFAKRPTLLHVQGKYFIPQAVLVGGLFKIPVVVTLRDYVVLCPHAYCIRKERGFRACNIIQLLYFDLPEFFKRFEVRGWWKKSIAILGTLYGWLVSQSLRFFLTRADRVVAISNKLKVIYERNHVLIDATIYNNFSTQPDKKRQSDKYLLFVGRLTEGKGFPIMIQAYAKLVSDNIPKLIVIGEGIRREDSMKNVEHLGQKNYSKTLEYIANAQLVIVPSVWEEPFGRVVLEALMLGVPVVATDRGGLPEIVDHNVTGVIVKPEPEALAQGIRRALKIEKNLRKNIQKQKPGLWQRFVTGPVEEYEELYQSIL